MITKTQAAHAICAYCSEENNCTNPCHDIEAINKLTDIELATIYEITNLQDELNNLKAQIFTLEGELKTKVDIPQQDMKNYNFEQRINKLESEKCLNYYQ